MLGMLIESYDGGAVLQRTPGIPCVVAALPRVPFAVRRGGGLVD